MYCFPKKKKKKINYVFKTFIRKKKFLSHHIYISLKAKYIISYTNLIIIRHILIIIIVIKFNI